MFNPLNFVNTKVGVELKYSMFYPQKIHLIKVHLKVTSKKCKCYTRQTNIETNYRELLLCDFSPSFVVSLTASVAYKTLEELILALLVAREIS